MQKPKINQLPADVRSEFETRLVQQGFSGYDELTEWLAEQGFEISRSSVHRYGQKFEQRLSALKVATDQAKAIAEASQDDEGAMNDAIIRLVQTKTFETLVELESDDPNLPKIGQMVAKLAQASVRQKKWQAQAKEKIAAKLDKMAEKDDAGKGGLTPELANTIRREILGVL